ncbi:MAG: winged helix-turn-helix transcriptional regulator [Propionibacteriaceae bacterium]|jgi:tetratricopeptide (TPR) repeat protein|nr:winged helix-turn-helix transcriptional regulator [Propionibacteriaceae bacterium]
MSDIARFTPSIHDGPTLEKLFVARQDILEDGVDRIRDAGESGRLAHVLYTGPRGSGKTHLISLIHHRATQLTGYGETFTLAWLDEDPWGIRSFDTFIEQVEAAKEHPDLTLTVVFAEGFDWILKALGAEGQRRLRARIEREANLLLITSSTRLTDNLIRQARPFYGFFDHIELRPFSLDQAIDMLTRAAQYDGDEALVARLAQPDVRPRLAAIAQLAGGQPRLWALLSAGLTVSNIDDMVSLLITKFDDLTPYYQEQLRGLSATELQIVWEFITNDRAMTPKEVAERTGISPQTVASTIKRLRPAWLEPRTGALQAFVDKRLTYYQLAEPLARVGPQLKQTRGRPVAMVVDFLAAWFSRYDLAETELAPLTLALPNLIQELASGPRADSPRGNEAESDQSDGPAGADDPGNVEMRVGVVSAMAALYRRYALRRAAEPAAQVREQWIGHWPKLRSTIAYPPRYNDAVVIETSRVAEALAQLQHQGSAELALALPVSLASLIEDRLAAASAGLMRIEIALIAVRAGGSEEWLGQALDALKGVLPAETRLAQVALAGLRAILGQTDAAVQTIESAFDQGDYLTSDEWDIVASALTHSNSALSGAEQDRLAAALVPYVSETDLPNLVGLIVNGPIDDAESGKALLAVCERMSTGSLTGEPSMALLLPLVTARALVDGGTNWFAVMARLAYRQCLLRDDFKEAIDELDIYVRAVSSDPHFDEADRLEIRFLKAFAEMRFRPTNKVIIEMRLIVAQAQERLGRFNSRTGEFLYDLAGILYEFGKVDESITLLRDRLILVGGVSGSKSRETLLLAQGLAHALHRSGRVDEALRLYIDLNERARRVLRFDDWIRRSICEGMAATAYDANDSGLRVQSYQQLLAVNLDSSGVKTIAPDIRWFLALSQLELALDLRDRGDIDGAIHHIEEALAVPAAIPPDAAEAEAATMELVELLERSGAANQVAQAQELRRTITAGRAAVLLERWRRECSAPAALAPDGDLPLVGPMPLALLEDIRERAQLPNAPCDAARRLDANFLRRTGLAQVPFARQPGLLAFVRSELVLRCADRLFIGLSPAGRDEFRLVAAKDKSDMWDWLYWADPDYASRPSYRQWVEENPLVGQLDLMTDYGEMLWLCMNFPYYEKIVRSELDQLERELKSVVPGILAACADETIDTGDIADQLVGQMRVG